MKEREKRIRTQLERKEKSIYEKRGIEKLEVLKKNKKRVFLRRTHRKENCRENYRISERMRP